MKTLFILLTTVLLTASASAQGNYEGWPAKITFKTTSMDLGTVAKGVVETVSFPFINDGTEPLVVSSSKASSKSLTVIFAKEPIKPGGTSEITVQYTANTAGKFAEKIMLVTNAQKKPIVLKVYGAVK